MNLHNAPAGSFKLYLSKYPNGKFGFVGSIPAELTYFDDKGLFPQSKSKVFDTEQEARAAAKNAGVEIANLTKEQ